MTDFIPPAGYEIMGPAAQERARRTYAATNRQAERVERIGPRELTMADGMREPNAWSSTIEGREWIVNGLIPSAQVTMINGNGGEGKSLVAAQLAVSATTGALWLSHRVKGVQTLYIHCEDDELEMKRRLNGILSPQGYSFADLDALHLMDRDGAENSLFYEAMGNETCGRFTEFYARVDATIQKYGIQLLILDSLYNFFGGNENIRSQVSEFVGGLKRLAKMGGNNCAVVVIAHPGRAGMGQGGDGTSGSTAWHNAVRSRFYLHRKKHQSGDPEKKGPLMFEHVKANYGPPAPPVELVWEMGRFVPVGDPQTVPHRDENDKWWDRK